MASTIEILCTKGALDLWSLLPATAGVEEAAEPSERFFAVIIERIMLLISQISVTMKEVYLQT